MYTGNCIESSNLSFTATFYKHKPLIFLEKVGGLWFLVSKKRSHGIAVGLDPWKLVRGGRTRLRRRSAMDLGTGRVDGFRGTSKGYRSGNINVIGESSGHGINPACLA